MTAYTLFGQPASPASLTADPAAYTMGVQFKVSQVLPLAAIWFFSAPGAAVLPQTIALFQVTGGGAGTLITSQAASWSGAAGSGWVRAPFTSPPQLTANTSYKACVLQTTAVNWYAPSSHYWDTGPGAGGITNGPLSAPNNTGGDGGQDTFNASAVLTYPASQFNSANYWVDPEVGTATLITGDDDTPWHIRSRM